MAFSWSDSSDIATLKTVFDAPPILKDVQLALRWLKAMRKGKVSEVQWPLHPLMARDAAALSLHRKIMSEVVLVNRLSGLRKFLPEPVCEVRPSKIHGLGVFATQDIDAGSYLTMYPCDGVAWYPEIGRFKHGDGGVCFGWPEKVSFIERHSYQQVIEPPPGARALAIFGNPEHHADPHFVGHMINDGAVCKTPESATVYKAISAAKLNSSFVADFCAHMSTRPIKAGEEILTSYGTTYWLTLHAEKPTVTVCHRVSS